MQKEIQVQRKEIQVQQKETAEKIRNWQVKFSDTNRSTRETVSCCNRKVYVARSATVVRLTHISNSQ